MQKNLKDVKVAYVGGGSKAWARNLMIDFALQDDFCGTVRLYDIDKAAAEKNYLISKKLGGEKMKSKWDYVVSDTLEEALCGADFVMISILPGTFDEMESDVHTPEKYGIYQSVGDTMGPGGIVRAMRTIPMIEVIAEGIKKCCPDAFVINFTNPMTWCTQTLHDVFPGIKAFGCCHEVFGTQALLADIVRKAGYEEATRYDIDVDVYGVNHFTWFTRAEYNGIDIFPLFDEYAKKHVGYYQIVSESEDTDYLKGVHDNCWESTEQVKIDLYRRYGQIAAAGDRHLAEFVNGSWYLKDPKTVAKYSFGLTPVSWRKEDAKEKIEKMDEIIASNDPLIVEPSGEEFTLLMKAILGVGAPYVSNVNYPNLGQMDFLPKGVVVEANALFSQGKIRPLLNGKPLNAGVQALVSKVVYEQQNVFRAIRSRDFKAVFESFTTDGLCSRISYEEAKSLFKEMVTNTKKYLSSWNFSQLDLI